MTEFILDDNDDFDNNIDLFISSNNFAWKTIHSIWTYDDKDVYYMSNNPDNEFGYVIELDFSPHKKPTTRSGLIEGSKFELIKILRKALDKYSKIFSNKINYKFYYVKHICNEKQSFRMNNLKIHL